MKKYISYIIPSIITFIILGIIFYFNNLYPFGVKPLVQVDADYIYIPILYKIWDILHYGGSIFYTDLGLGNSIYGSLIIQGSLYSPLNLMLYLVNRDNLINFMGLFIIIKLCILTFTSYIYINYKYHNVNCFYKILFSVLYTFSGYVIFNYFNHMWLDIVILLPILAIYLDKLLNNKNVLGYTIILSICLIMSFYYSYFILIFILFYSFIYIMLYKRENAREVVFNLGKGTLIAIMISAFSSIPLMHQILTSSRFHTDVSTEIFSNLPMKSLYILFSPLMITTFILLLTKFKTNKKTILGYAILIILYLIPVLIDPVNALLHGGTYWSFPYRYGFIASFILMDASLYYISNYAKENNTKLDLIDKISYILIMILLSAVIYINLKQRSIIIDKGILLGIDNEIYIILMYVICILFAYGITQLIKSKIYKYTAVAIISLFSIFLFTSLTIYYNKGYFLTTNAKNLSDKIELKKDGRYKVEYDTYTPYYGLMYNVDALDNWLHIMPSNVIESHRKLGYCQIDTRDYSYGGTIFSDYLLNFKYVLSNEDKKKDDMYQLIDKYDNKYLYKYNYKLANAIPFNEVIDIKDDGKFDYQNKIYKNLFNKDKDIINYKDYASSDQEEFIYKVTKPGYLYLDAPAYDDLSSICINDNCIFKDREYIKYLGYFDSDIKIKINALHNEKFIYQLGFINKEDIMELSSNVTYENNTYYVDNDNNYKYLYIPVNNLKGIKVYNNNKEVNTYKYLDTFIYIKLNKGKNEIKIKYQEPYFNIGLILSFIGILLLIINKKIKPNKLLLNIAYYLFNFITIFLFLYFYLYSIIKYIIAHFIVVL